MVMSKCFMGSKFTLFALVTCLVYMRFTVCQEVEGDLEYEPQVTTESPTTILIDDGSEIGSQERPIHEKGETEFSVNISSTNIEANYSTDGNATWEVDYNTSVTGNLSTEATTLPPPTDTTETSSTPTPQEESAFFVDDFCICDLKVGFCDVNCCCDEDCSEEDRKVFSRCQTRPQPVLDPRYCYQRHIVFGSNTEYQVDVVESGMFCIITDNLPRRTVYSPIKGATTLEEYNKLQSNKRVYSWQQHLMEEAPSFVEVPYSAGKPVWGVSSDGTLFYIGVPTSVIGVECETTEPLQYLKAAQSTCSRVFPSLPDACQNNPSFGVDSFVAFVVVADPTQLFQNISASDTKEVTVTTTKASATPTIVVTEPSSTAEPTVLPFGTPEAQKVKINEESPHILALRGLLSDRQSSMTVNEDVLLPVKPFLCVGQSDENCVEISVIPKPVFSGGVCVNVTKSIHYLLIHNGTEGILEVQARIYLANLTADVMHFTQSFGSEFIWASARESVVFERSGRPGYLTGKPLILGTLVTNITEEGEWREAILLDSNQEQWLTILAAGGSGKCDDTQSPVNFGVEMRTGCVVEVTESDLADCPRLQERFINLLLGPSLKDADMESLRVAAFGDASVNSAADWVPVLVPVVPRDRASSAQSVGKKKCSDLTISLHLEVAYSLQGALANPQAKVVAVVLHYGAPQSIEFPCHSVNCNSLHESLTLDVELVSSVSFVDVTRPAEASYASPPTLDIKLPYDFFYPFLPSAACLLQVETVSVWAMCCVLLLYRESFK